MCSQNKTVEYRKKFVFVSWPKFITPALCSQRMSSSVHCSTAARNCGNINSNKKSGGRIIFSTSFRILDEYTCGGNNET